MPLFLRVHTWIVFKMSKATVAALFNSTKGASDAASLTIDKIRVDPCSEASLQLTPPDRSVSFCEFFLPLPFDGAIVMVGIKEARTFSQSLSARSLIDKNWLSLRRGLDPRCSSFKLQAV